MFCQPSSWAGLPRCQLHQHFTCAFFVRKCIFVAKILYESAACNCVIFGAKILYKKLSCKTLMKFTEGLLYICHKAKKIPQINCHKISSLNVGEIKPGFHRTWFYFRNAHSNVFKPTFKHPNRRKLQRSHIIMQY